MAAGNRDDPDDARTSRRAFLRRAGIGAAGAAVGAGAVGAGVAAARGTDAERYGFAPLPERAEPGFDHVVVLMFENRSFDHVLGRLYTDAELRPGQSFAGLQRGTHENTAPDGTVVAAHVYEGSTDVVMSQPDPDPGEFYPHVNTQWFGTVDPPGNADPGRNGYAAPYNAPADTSRPTMSGFVRDYVVNYRLERGVEPTRDEYERVMGGFSPAMLPVFSTLAKSFAVYDHWFCAVPSQTFCNRSFLHASTSHGFVTNGQPTAPRSGSTPRTSRRCSPGSRTRASAGACTSTPTRSSRSPASCTPRRSSGTGRPTSGAWRSSTRTRRTAPCPTTPSSSRG